MSGLPSFLGACRLAIGGVSNLTTSRVSHKVLRNIQQRSSNHRDNDIIIKIPSVFSYSTQAEDKKTQPENGQSEVAQKDPAVQLEELNKTLDEVTKQRDDATDKYKRALAEGENMRKRLTKQIDEAKIYGIQSFCKDLLEVADVLAKATECVPKEEVSDSNPHLKNLYEGLTMTEAQLQKVFKRHGLVPVNPIDEKFDPNLHEALFQQEVEGKTPGTVVVVSKIGYKLHERVVRPALVGVAKG